MDVFKIDLEQSHIHSSLVESHNSTNNSSQTHNLYTPGGIAGGADNREPQHTTHQHHNHNHNHNQNLHQIEHRHHQQQQHQLFNDINANDDCDDEDDPLPEVSFDANSDFNLHFFDTPDDSSTQGAFSDAGSLESDAYATSSPPTPPTTQLHALRGVDSLSEESTTVTASASAATQLHIGDTINSHCNRNAEVSESLKLLTDDCTSFYQHQQQSSSSSSTLNGSTPPSLGIASNCVAYLGSATNNNTTAQSINGGIAGNSSSSAASTPASSVSSTSTASTSPIALASNGSVAAHILALGNGGGTLYANSSLHTFCQSQHSSSSSGCSSNSSAGSSCSHNGNTNAGQQHHIGRSNGATVSSLVAEHCLGERHHTAAAAATTAITSRPTAK
uniref:Ecdysone-induced protein 78C n=1 Tax=Zeugodacus cucurbitae TaxID=28588 RepID=A0A0A1XSM2_ZEUCU